MIKPVFDGPIFLLEDAADFPGWQDWQLVDPDRFNHAVLGRLLVRKDSATQATVRMFPEYRHGNMLNVMHGGATLGFIDVALFGAGRQFGIDDSSVALTLDLSTQFIGGGKMDVPLDAEVELLRETNRLMFLRGKVVQDDGAYLVASFSATIRKSATPVNPEAPAE